MNFDFNLKYFSVLLWALLIMIMINNSTNNFFISGGKTMKKGLINLKTEVKTNTFLMQVLNIKKLLCVFMMIVVLNLVGFLSFSFTLTSHISYCLGLGLIFWLMVNLFFIMKKSKKLISHLIPYGSPLLLSPFMVLIETISNLVRPMTLSIRLMANLTAGHLILILISSPGVIISIFSLPLLLINLLELLVCVIQAYIFMTLISMYWGEV